MFRVDSLGEKPFRIVLESKLIGTSWFSFRFVALYKFQLLSMQLMMCTAFCANLQKTAKSFGEYPW